MAHFAQFSEEALSQIHEQIGERLGHLQTEFPPGDLSLAESMPVWMLGVDSVQKSGADARLNQLAERTGSWHHQIVASSTGRGAAFAWSMPEDDDEHSWEVTELAVSELAARLGDAIEWIDHAELDGDPRAQLLVVPGFHLHAFWLAGEAEGAEDQVVVADLSSGGLPLEIHRVYTESDFLGALRNAEPVVGLHGGD